MFLSIQPFGGYVFPRQNGFFDTHYSLEVKQFAPEKGTIPNGEGLLPTIIVQRRAVNFQGVAFLGQKGEASVGSPLWCEIAS